MKIYVATKKDLGGSYSTREVDIGSLEEAFSESTLDRFFVEHGGCSYSFYKKDGKVCCYYQVRNESESPKHQIEKVTPESVFESILKMVSGDV